MMLSKVCCIFYRRNAQTEMTCDSDEVMNGTILHQLRFDAR
jgi:hypothetical protein